MGRVLGKLQAAAMLLVIPKTSGCAAASSYLPTSICILMLISKLIFNGDPNSGLGHYPDPDLELTMIISPTLIFNSVLIQILIRS